MPSIMGLSPWNLSMHSSRGVDYTRVFIQHMMSACMELTCLLYVQVSLLLLPSVDDFEEQMLAGLSEDLIYEVCLANQYCLN